MLVGALLALVTALAAGLRGLRDQGHELRYSAMVAGLWVVAAGLAAQWLRTS